MLKWYMLDQKDKDALHRKPSGLHRISQDGVKWIDALRFLVEDESQGKLLNKYYASLSEEHRKTATSIIASSNNRDCIRKPDASYLYAWLEHAFTRMRQQLTMGHSPYSGTGFGGRNTTVLSAWLRQDPILLRSLPFLAAAAFRRSGAYSHVPNEMESLLDCTIPRQFRSRRFYSDFVAEVPTALIIGARYMEEQACLLNMCVQQCRYAAGLSRQWRSVYPNSPIADEVNQLLSTMQALDTYVPELLKASLGLTTKTLFDVTPLPNDMDIA